MLRAASRSVAEIPLRWVGPIRLRGPVLEEEIRVPLATFETPLWPSVARGARVSRATPGITVVVPETRMSRSVIVEAPTVTEAVAITNALPEREQEIAAAVEFGSRYTRFQSLWSQVIGNLVYLRLEVTTGDAAGHNMVTTAAERMLSWLLENYPALRYVSISGNACSDKKVSAINGIRGRGHFAIGELIVPTEVCRDILRSHPVELANLHVKKNLVGSIVSGGIRTANAHVANMLLAMYLATGQDGANIVEGSQAIVHAEAREEGLYFSVTLPHLIVGTVGNGKEHPFVRENLERLGCLGVRPVGENARRLAAIIAGAALCGELSLLAAQVNRGELTRAHDLFERR